MNIGDLLKIAAQMALYRFPVKKRDIKMLRSLMQLIEYRINWEKRDLDYCPDGLTSGKFMSARKAVEMIDDGKNVISTGIAGNSRCSIYYWAIRDRFERTRHPKNLTWISLGAVGARGKAPGTIEELGIPGIITRHIVGHSETHKSLLKLADDGQMELHTMPIGTISLLLEAQGSGKKRIISDVGVGTFLDPRVGRGSMVSPDCTKSYIKAAGKRLEYTLPGIDVAILCASYADREGNVYFKNAATITESIIAARAARKNRGLVLATVCDIIPNNDSEISLPADMVDAIVVNPRNEQTGGVLQRKYFPMFTEGARVDIVDAFRLVRFINTFMGITPHRGPVENALSRMAASLFVHEARPGNIINIGVGLPEEVSRLLFESGLYRDLVFTTESGVYGGLPTSGMYFGAAINPERMESSSWMFHLYEKKLDITVLGFLQVDSEGNVNVSKRGPRMLDYVGPGGFPNVSSWAKKIIFIGNWKEGARSSINNGKLSIKGNGVPKFVDRVDEITFNAQRALEKGKKVFYVTTVGIFRLTKMGMELMQVMPGVDIQKDILDACTAKILLPKDGTVSIVPLPIVTGEGFTLTWQT
ncbi:MAG: malonate decarboxylase subunit alpha [Spirochaetes bacterium]|nr:malonate decarboxylase subunit alpha [Spirochaetota bacterium]